MDRWNRGGVIKQRSDYQDDSDGEYHEPQEPVVHYPRQNQSPSEYSDRRPWTPGKESKNIADILPPRLPKRPPGCAPPIVNRDLKPGRQPKNIPEPWTQNKGSNERTTKTPPRPVRNQPQDCLDHGSVPTQSKFNYRPHTSSYGASSTEEESVSNSRLTIGSKGGSINRHSLDLESYDMDRRSSVEENAVRDTYRQRHHEWPQDKGDAENNNYTGHDKPVEASADQNWYVGAFSRVEAEHALHLVNQEGAFLVRDCSRNTTQEPFVLAIFYNNRVFNIQIRFCAETCKYMLGTKVKTDDRFDSVAEIIKFHTIFPILLIDGRNQSAASNPKRQCLLMYPVTKQDMDLLLNKTSLQSSAQQMQ